MQIRVNSALAFLAASLHTDACDITVGDILRTLLCFNCLDGQRTNRRFESINVFCKCRRDAFIGVVLLGHDKLNMF